jgi:phage terminase Nu1 subunit (DNA packaging protein)
MSKQPEPGQVSQLQLAELLGVTPKTIRAWERQGCPVERKARRGLPSQYSVAAVFRWREEQARLAASGNLDAMDMEEAKRRKLAAEAAAAELSLARERDEVVEIDLVSKEVGTALAACRSRLLQVGAKVAPQCELTPDAASVKELIDDAIYEALDEISGDALEYAGAPDGDGADGAEEASRNDDEATAEADA